MSTNCNAVQLSLGGQSRTDTRSKIEIMMIQGLATSQLKTNCNCGILFPTFSLVAARIFEPCHERQELEVSAGR